MNETFALPFLWSKSLLITFILLVGCLNGKSKTYQKFSSDCMGTKFTILIDDLNRSNCQSAADAAFSKATLLNSIFSDYISNSEISRLSNSSHEGRPMNVSNELFEIIEYGQKLSEETDGAFDLTVGAASRLWRIARFRKRFPSKENLSNALSRIGHTHLSLDKTSKKIRILKPGVLLDLGGIAKGYTADRMLETIQGFGIKRCLIDAGGDLVIGQAPKGESGWKVKVGGKNHPDLPTLILSNCAVATSGDTNQFLEIDGQVYSHLINPRTAVGLMSRSQVTVIAGNGMTADSLASASLVLGFNDSAKIFEAYNIAAAYFVKNDNGKDFIFKFESKS